ncbi:glycosyl hydrolase [uncultured Dokdonia sp.]|uniref:WD40/YVTN/BNR-like repeat-containing protein n=1 Tax=uncultured Dokdonia sp. TaxID=575653 RepID=UPI0030ECB97A|tara:strand:- start:97884 stop:100754 length:2871 start_codon:yes stop_codon:yes gene_type:complete
MKLRYFLASSAVLFALTKGQSQQPATSIQLQEQAVLQKEQSLSNSIVKNIPFENIGPSVMSGRIVDIAVNPDMPSEFYAGYASGGLWYTNNNGTTFTPVMDNAPTQNVGEVTVDWKSGTIWVGTGENNASRSSYAGIGLLKSTDKGATWQHMGLIDSHHIGRILINPSNPDEVVVGALGHLYSDNEERGIYKTKDGGKTWKKTLFIDNKTGIIDIDNDPANFNLMYASAWQKDRKAWNFEGAGAGSGIYKSTDGGDTWQQLTNFPSGDGVGRIGIAVYDENTVYAVHDSQFRREGEGKKSSSNKLEKDDFKTMSKDALLALDDKKLDDYLKRNGFQEKYRAANVKSMVRQGDVQPVDLATYLETANTQMFDTPVVGAEVYRSNDGGATWSKTHEGYIEDLYYSYGYYFGEINVNPSDAQDIYIYGVPIVKSKDGGKTFTSINAPNVHSDHHALWINPKNEKHLINGNDGGINISYDDGASWIKANDPSVGQFYFIQVDNEEPYNIYGGLQDNGVWVAPSTAQESRGWLQNGQYPWESIMGGDGMQVQVDSRDANIVYTGFQFGNYFRINRETGENKRFDIKHTLGEKPYRFNWQTPILLSSHNQDILYLGGNKLMRSMDQGDSWTAISPDLTHGGKPGNVAYGTLTSVSESPFQFGLIYTGSDDGKISVTKNGGSDWQVISNTLPKDLWVSRVVASEHKKERVYATLNGYRWDDFATYIYVSDNYGQTWKNISAGIPMSPVNVIIEDPVKENIIYVGTDNGAYVSMNGGESYNAFAKAVSDKTTAPLPAVAVHDMKIQKKANHLLLGTHGRSIYRADLAPIQQVNTGANAQIFDIASVRSSGRWGNSWSSWSEPNEPNVAINYYTSNAGKFSMVIKDAEGKEVQRVALLPSAGLNVFNYDLSIAEKGKKILEKANSSLDIQKAKSGKYYLPKGVYTVSLDGGGGNSNAAQTTLEIK